MSSIARAEGMVIGTEVDDFSLGCDPLGLSVLPFLRLTFLWPSAWQLEKIDPLTAVPETPHDSLNPAWP